MQKLILVAWISNTLQYNCASKSHGAASQLTSDINIESFRPNSSMTCKWTPATIKSNGRLLMALSSVFRVAHTLGHCKCGVGVVNKYTSLLNGEWS